MLIVYRFYHIQHRRSGAKIVAASGHQEVKNCTQTYLRRGSAPDPAGRAYIALRVALVGGEGARSLRVSALRLPSPGKKFWSAAVKYRRTGVECRRLAGESCKHHTVLFLVLLHFLIFVFVLFHVSTFI